MTAASPTALRACHCCGLVQEVPAVSRGSRAVCVRCRTTVRHGRRRFASNRWTAAVAAAALVLYLPAIALPVLEIERFGHLNRASIWGGSLSLLGAGELVVGGVVFLCSIVVPLFKILGLLAITRSSSLLGPRNRARTYRVIEWTGRWGMVDVLLVACLVAFLKLGDVAEVTPGPGVLLFTAMVIASLVASALFDPHALWEDERSAVETAR